MNGRVLKADYNLETGAFHLSCGSCGQQRNPGGKLVGRRGNFRWELSGERGRPNKRDFGILVGKDGKLLVGIGVLMNRITKLSGQHPLVNGISPLTREKKDGTGPVVC